MKRLVGIGLVAGVLGVVALAAGKLLQIGNSVGGKQGFAKTWIGINHPLEQFPANTQRINVLLIGKDYNHTNKDILYTKGSRSDTLMVFSLDLQNKTISALSIPRDTYIPARHGKINAAYAQGGAPMAIDTVGKLIGLRPDYYIALKPDGVKALVDKIGGVEVTALDIMKYDDHWGGLHIDMPAGTYTINGDQAIGYTRFRKSNPGLPHSKEEGDSRRMARQQNLIRAMATRAKNPAVLMQADQVLNVAFDQIETNLSRNQIVALATIFRQAEPEKITSATLMGEDGREGAMYVFKPDTTKMKHMVDWILRGDASAANALTVVSVQNATEIKGAARRVAESLKQNGFDAHADGSVTRASGSDTPAQSPKSRITYHKATFETQARSIARLTGITEVVKDTQPVTQEAASTEDTGAHPADVTVVLGLDLAQQAPARQSASRE